PKIRASQLFTERWWSCVPKGLFDVNVILPDPTFQLRLNYDDFKLTPGPTTRCHVPHDIVLNRCYAWRTIPSIVQYDQRVLMRGSLQTKKFVSILPNTRVILAFSEQVPAYVKVKGATSQGQMEFLSFEETRQRCFALQISNENNEVSHEKTPAAKRVPRS